MTLDEMIAKSEHAPPDHKTEPPDLVARLTAAVREADLRFESTGGSSRHFVRECLLPALEKAGLTVVSVNVEKQ